MTNLGPDPVAGVMLTVEGGPTLHAEDGDNPSACASIVGDAQTCLHSAVLAPDASFRVTARRPKDVFAYAAQLLVTDLDVADPNPANDRAELSYPPRKDTGCAGAGEGGLGAWGLALLVLAGLSRRRRTT